MAFVPKQTRLAKPGCICKWNWTGINRVVLPVWADDTVSLVWFYLAAVALGSHYKVRNKNA